MRSRERFLQVAKTVNPRLYPQSSDAFFRACPFIEAGQRLPDWLEDDLITLAYHESPHIRSLAADALHYGGKDFPESGNNLPRTERETENKGERK